MPHLPDAYDDEDESLGDGPPQDALVGALARHAEALLAILKEKNGQTRTCEKTFWLRFDVAGLWLKFNRLH